MIHFKAIYGLVFQCLTHLMEGGSIFERIHAYVCAWKTDPCYILLQLNGYMQHSLRFVFSSAV